MKKGWGEQIKLEKKLMVWVDCSMNNQSQSKIEMGREANF